MGIPSAGIKEQLKNFCKKGAYCGWRSPYDQNEIFICRQCMLDCLTNERTYYEVAKLPQNMATMYWFPNQKVFDTMGRYDEGNGENVVAGMKALNDGKTLAFYAWTDLYQMVPQDEGGSQEDFVSFRKHFFTDLYQTVPIVKVTCDEPADESQPCSKNRVSLERKFSRRKKKVPKLPVIQGNVSIMKKTVKSRARLKEKPRPKPQARLKEKPRPKKKKLQPKSTIDNMEDESETIKK